MTDTYLVTGGAGFIGSHMARRLLSTGAEVVIVDNMLTGREDNIPPGARFIEMDLARADHYSRLEGCTPKAIFHLAGQSSGEISFESPEKDLDINTRATILLGQWAVKQECSRFLYASSVSVYGDGQQGRAMVESDNPEPKTFYACSKLASEQYLKVFASSYGMKTTTFRFFNVYGPGQNMANMKQGMVSIYLAYVLFKEILEVKGSFNRFRDFVYIDDVIDFMLTCQEDSRSFGKIFNVGTGRRTTVRQLITEMLAVAGKQDFPVIELPGTPGDAFGSWADMSYVKEVMGWAPKVLLEEGIRKMVRFHAPDLLPGGD